MGTYINPGNSAFSEIIKSDYVDKTAMIHLINKTIGTSYKLTCISRPRRFGKSYAAQMLSAYYDCSCDSNKLFESCKITDAPDYSVHLNQYNVLYLDISGFISDLQRQHLPVSNVTIQILKNIREEMIKEFPELAECPDVSDCFVSFVEKTGRKFIFIIDEWDAVIRETGKDQPTQKAYLNLLRSWFKNGNFTPKVVAAAYMTGILPIKKDGSQSAISDFTEYPVLFPGRFGEFTGFTESEVRKLCKQHDLDFQKIKHWYDGYYFPECGSVYNPYSVMQAIRNRKCRSYWQKTSAAESLMTYINMDFDGLQEMIVRLISGESVSVDVDTYENDFETFKNKDDVLTLLIHLGYLSYCEDDKTVHIPNEEVAGEFQQILRGTSDNAKWIQLLQKSDTLLENTISGNECAVAEAISEIRNTEYAPTFYNDEQALRYIIKFAYIAAIEKYVKVEELPSGHGLADVVYIPKRNSVYPALVIELKWNQPASGAIKQILDRNYPAVLQDFGGEIVLVGISYDSSSKNHSCKIKTISV